VQPILFGGIMEYCNTCIFFRQIDIDEVGNGVCKKLKAFVKDYSLYGDRKECKYHLPKDSSVPIRRASIVSADESSVCINGLYHF
jgi:hypothetical protein